MIQCAAPLVVYPDYAGYWMPRLRETWLYSPTKTPPPIPSRRVWHC
jgi:hypothetical protein